ncbi:5-methyltetrahydropteroyltriglutamate--homocysteine S-methyltransferase [Bosea sp. PAMC 26642]|uniref:5-methyltetrahydropteroyltriglutamate-- homocysteine S-methyltransferase n=1 Tax=Bosea sp. (strain PAMC 26642) TaxID=1792307 RepID=UPI0007703E3F|nr:5-methyltetrahydropteroyltriglutamate--homocysteine S-methyltransferase [Bosea sp. PAMC 26642]AMJ60287.1 methionine synthase [Bosea sp. PAMC 26642]
MTSRQKPPFRGDMVGSLLRSTPVKDARAKAAAGEISPAELTAIEDEEIRKLVRKQEDIGLQAVTDGEYRRAFWHFDFLEALTGVTGYDSDSGIQFKGVATKARGIRVTGKLDFPDDHPHLAHFRFLASVTSRVPKMTIPSPSMLHYRGGRKAIDASAYYRMEDYYDDLGKAYAKAIKAFYDAGCRYLQLDDTSLSYFCDPEQRKMLAERGDDPDKLIFIYRDILNAALKAKPADMAITTHTCRGNFKSTFIASGGYEPVADMVFNQIDVDGYFMEWDDDRSGGFEPLRFLPKGDKQVVLGLVTSKFGTVESKDNLKRRIEEAAKFAALDQLCLSPQCGFASTEEGNVLAEDEQWAKLSRILEVAKEVWG